jgi:C1A family cysteine protease
MPLVQRKFDVRRDVHDVRDRMFVPRRSAPKAFPPIVDLRRWAGPIKDQGEEGACTGHAFTSAREWIARRFENNSLVLSPQSLYVQELLLSGDFPTDAGAAPRTACQALTSYGACELSLWPYVAGQIVRPTPEQAANAIKYKTGAYHRLASLADFQGALSDATPWPVTIGFTVYDSFMSEQVATSGIMPVPQQGEKVQGGHEVLCLGYDMTRMMALCQNSWGPNWGQGGYFWMPLEVALSADTDLWIVHTGPAWK